MNQIIYKISYSNQIIYKTSFKSNAKYKLQLKLKVKVTLLILGGILLTLTQWLLKCRVGKQSN